MKPRFLFLLAALLVVTGLGAAERIPPVPTRYFNDYAGITSGGTADTLNRQLEQFERDSSSQLLVVIYPKMESDSSVEDYTVRIATAWKAGQAGKNNGAVLFAFMQEHQLYLQVGYGLEGAIPDATAKRIIEREIVPRFRAGDMNGGMTAAVNAMIAAAKGEYKGTGATQADQRRNGSSSRGPGFGAIFVLIMVIVFAAAQRRRSSALPYIIASTLIRPGGSRWNSGRSSGGGFFGGGGGGGGFSGGGGSFGGGGAGGKW